jgi:hypothetical protein
MHIRIACFNNKFKFKRLIGNNFFQLYPIKTKTLRIKFFYTAHKINELGLRSLTYMDLYLYLDIVQTQHVTFKI